ncbi:hypothetical protein IQ243_01230 [Nostocales cyanobacterium LEGE 11386]|nr:hypothetical protein [Nostocales cyanobacterium LEGE 11386]
MVAAKQKHSNLFEEAESRLRQLSLEQLEVVVAFLAYLQATKQSEVTQELLRIPNFAIALCETENSKNQLEDTTSNQIVEDAEAWQAYLASKQKWQEVYRRLADS